MAEHPMSHILIHVILVLERYKVMKNDWLSCGAPLIAVNKWKWGPWEIPLEGAYKGCLWWEMGAEHLCREQCPPHLGLFPSTINEGSSKTPDTGLVGYLAIYSQAPPVAIC